MWNDFGITLTETDKLRLDSFINKVITYSTPRTLEFKSCPVFPLWPESSIEVWLTDRQAGETGRPKDKHIGGSSAFETSHI